jgi:hypothetical protein
MANDNDIDINKVQWDDTPQSQGIDPTKIQWDDQVNQPVTGPGKVESAIRGLAQGASFGFADELTALGESAFTPKTYQQALAESRANYKSAEEANPATYMGSDVVGSVLPAIATGGLGLTGLAGRGVARMAASGALQGGLRGAGDAPTMSDIPSEVAKGAGIGAVTGGALSGMGSVGNVIENKIAPIIANRVTDIGKGFASKNTPFVGPVFDSMVDSLRNRYINQGIAPDVAEQMANRMAGRLALTSGEITGIPGGLGVGTAITDVMAKPTGQAIQWVSNKANKAGYATAGGITNAISSDVPTDEPLVGNISAGQAFNASQGTKYESVLRNAQQRGKEAMSSTIWSLSQDPEFRELLNKRQ